MNNDKQNMLSKQRVIFIALSLIVAFIAHWLFTHSRISVSVSSSRQEDVTYSFRDTATGETRSISSSSKKITTWVKRGSYEVSSSSESGNFIVFVPQTPFFYKLHAISGELKPEKTRSFVGENLRSCAALIASKLISGGCEGAYGALSVHYPPTQNTPAYIGANPDRSIFGENQALITMGDSPIQIIKSRTPTSEGTEIGPSSISKYYAISLNNDLTASKKTELTELGGLDQLGFKAISDSRFVAYKNSPDVLTEYSPTGQKVSEVRLEKPDTKNTSLASVDYVSNRYYATVYAKTIDEQKKDELSELIIVDESKTTHYVFENRSYYSIALCGTKKVCLLSSNSELDVYDVSSGTAKIDFSVSKVSFISRVATGKNIFAVNDSNVLNIDADARRGHSEYSFGDYNFNEINVHKNGYVLHMVNNKGRVVGLYIDQSIGNSDSIDKKIAKLQQTTEVSFVSINGKYVYISANLQLIYDQQQKGNVYDPASTKATAQKINAEIDRLGIDRSKYTITSNAF